jgi:hypothetical protein
MALPNYSDLNIPDSPQVDSWENPEPYLDPLTSDMEGGNKRLRTRPGDETSRISYSILFTKAQYAIFKNFNLVTLNRGTSRYTKRVWNGSAMVTKTVQNASRPIPSTQEPFIIVKFDMWVYGGL